MYPKVLYWAHYCFYYISMNPQMSLMNFLFIYLLMTQTYSLNQAMGKLINWLNSNRLALNVSKTNFVIFSAKNKPLKPVTIIINGPSIEQKDYVNYLGDLIDSKLLFKQHIIGITKKISRAIGLLYELRHYVSMLYQYMGQLIRFILTQFISCKKSC